jgi:hypothetical protein
MEGRTTKSVEQICLLNAKKVVGKIRVEGKIHIYMLHMFISDKKDYMLIMTFDILPFFFFFFFFPFSRHLKMCRKEIFVKIKIL